MVDLVNQGKGDVLKIWGTSNHFKLSQIKKICNETKEDFYNPTKSFRNKIIKNYEITGICEGDYNGMERKRTRSQNKKNT